LQDEIAGRMKLQKLQISNCRKINCRTSKKLQDIQRLKFQKIAGHPKIKISKNCRTSKD
jgi:hypothetical protein